MSPIKRIWIVIAIISTPLILLIGFSQYYSYNMNNAEKLTDPVYWIISIFGIVWCLVCHFRILKNNSVCKWIEGNNDND